MFSQTSHSSRRYSTSKVFENVSIYRTLGAFVVDGQGKKGRFNDDVTLLIDTVKKFIWYSPTKNYIKSSSWFSEVIASFDIHVPCTSVWYRNVPYICKETLPAFSQFGSVLKLLYSHTFRFTTLISLLAIVENEQEERMNEQLSFIF